MLIRKILWLRELCSFMSAGEKRRIYINTLHNTSVGNKDKIHLNTLFLDFCFYKKSFELCQPQLWVEPLDLPSRCLSVTAGTGQTWIQQTLWRTNCMIWFQPPVYTRLLEGSKEHREAAWVLAYEKTSSHAWLKDPIPVWVTDFLNVPCSQIAAQASAPAHYLQSASIQSDCNPAAFLLWVREQTTSVPRAWSRSRWVPWLSFLMNPAGFQDRLAMKVRLPRSFKLPIVWLPVVQLSDLLFAGPCSRARQPSAWWLSTRWLGSYHEPSQFPARSRPELTFWEVQQKDTWLLLTSCLFMSLPLPSPSSSLLPNAMKVPQPSVTEVSHPSAPADAGPGPESKLQQSLVPVLQRSPVSLLLRQSCGWPAAISCNCWAAAVFNINLVSFKTDFNFNSEFKRGLFIF